MKQNWQVAGLTKKLIYNITTIEFNIYNLVTFYRLLFLGLFIFFYLYIFFYLFTQIITLVII